MSIFDVIAFDADDTLWHNERLYVDAQVKLARLLAPYGVVEAVGERLYRTESRNIRYFGYGIKSYTLSMIETAVELTGGRISGREVLAIIGLAKEMLEAKVELLGYAAETVSRLAASHHLMIITKGDLLDQRTKIERSGLGGYFQSVEVVSDKTPESYRQLFGQHAIDPRRVLMVGNSLRSDILPILELGGRAAYIPYQTTWAHEAAEPPPPGKPGFYQLENLSQLPVLVERIERGE
jgi:putative hydrolase of the HAD superfamily